MTMTNAEWILKEGIPFKNIKTIQHNPKETHWYEIAVNGKVVDKIVSKLEPADLFRKWLDSEHKEPILDEAERNYLSAVIRPFRDGVREIRKIQSIYRLPDDGKEYIKICMCTGEEVNFPYFRKGSMYKGMETGKRYTLEELGL